MNTTPLLKSFRVALTHHYGVEIYGVEAPDLATAAYCAVRASHAFLTDTNHRHEVIQSSSLWGNVPVPVCCVAILKNEESPAFELAPAWVPDGPGARWFRVQCREAAPGEVNADWIEAVKRRRAQRSAA